MAVPNPFEAILFPQGASNQESELDQPEQANQPVQPEINPFEAILFPNRVAPEPVAPPEEKGTFENLWAGLKERGADLTGDLAGGVQTIGQAAEESESFADLGGVVHRGGMDFDYLNAEEWAKYSEDNGRMGLLEIQDDWKNTSYGFTSNSAENWELLKGDAPLWEKVQAAGAFALETGVISLADMAGAVVVPPAYIVARTEEIAQDRAINQGRPGKPSNEDLAIAFTTATIIAAMERFGFEQIAAAFVKGGGALQKILRGFLGEGVTEGIQEPLEYAAETYGTPVEEAQTPGEYRMGALERSAQGILGGGPAGAALATPGAIFGPKEKTISDDVRPLEENQDAITRELANQAPNDELLAADQVSVEQRELDEEALVNETKLFDLSQKTFPTALHAEVAKRKFQKESGSDVELFVLMGVDGEWVVKQRSMRDAIEIQKSQPGLDVRPTEAPIEVTEAEEIDIGLPNPSSEGIEATEIGTEDLGEGIPQIGVTEIQPDEEITMKGGKTFHVTPLTEAETEVERVKTKVKDLSNRVVKAALKEAGMKQAGTREEQNERMTTGREAIETIGKKYKTQREILDAAESGEIDRATLFRFAKAVARGNEKIDEMGIWQNARKLSGWLSRVLGKDGPTPMSDSDWAQWRREEEARKAEEGKSEVESQLAMVEKHLADMPTNIDSMSDEAPAQSERIAFLLKKKRDLTDQRDEGLSLDGVKAERKELIKTLFKTRISIPKNATLADLRKLAEKGTADTINNEDLPSSFGLYDNIPKEVKDLATGIMSETEAHPSIEDYRVFTDDNVNIEFEPFGENEKAIELKIIEAETPGQGDGSAALEKLLGLADKHGVDIIVNPVASSTKGGLSQDQLVKWYEDSGFGLMEDYDDYMVYSGAPDTEFPGTKKGTDLKETSPSEVAKVPGPTGTDTLPDGTEYALSHTKFTQVPNTVGTYDKAKDEYFADVDNGDILDYGAGMGLASKKHGFESLEPYPTGFTPDYMQADDIDRQYDGIILNNILNVLPSHTRHVVLADAAKRRLAPGGRMYINVRSRGDVMSQESTAKKVFSKSEILTQKNTYQKGFQRPELIKYLQRELGDGYTVESAKFGSVAVIVTKLDTATTTEPTAKLKPTQFKAPVPNENEVYSRKDGNTTEYTATAKNDRTHGEVVSLETSPGVWIAEHRYMTTNGGSTSPLSYYSKSFDNENDAKRAAMERLLKGARIHATEHGEERGGVGTKASRARADKLVKWAESELEKLGEAKTEKLEPTQTEPTDSEAQKAGDAFIASHPEFKGTKFSHKPGDERNGRTVTDYYGEILNTEDADGMPIDVVLNKNHKPKAKTPVFVINQKDPKTGKFIQHKVMTGFATKKLARQSYVNMWGDEGFGSVHRMSVESFDQWKESGDTKAEFKPMAWAKQLHAIRKDQRKAEHAKFLRSEFDKSQTYSKSNKRNHASRMRPDPDVDSAVDFLRKQGGLDMITQPEVPQGRLKHLNELNLTPGLWSIEQTEKTSGDGLSLPEATTRLWQAGYITADDDSQTIKLLYESENTPQYTPTGFEANTQREIDAKYEEEMDREADPWADFVSTEYEFNEVDPETARLMALAGEIDLDGMDDIIAKDIPEADVQALLQELIDDKKSPQPETDPSEESALEAVRTDEAEPAPTTAPETEPKTKLTPAQIKYAMEWGMIQSEDQAEEYYALAKQLGIKVRDGSKFPGNLFALRTMARAALEAAPEPVATSEEEVSEPAPEYDTTPNDIASVLDDTSQATGTETALADIMLTAEDGPRKVSHNAGWWKKAIDDRLVNLNKLRGCA